MGGALIRAGDIWGCRNGVMWVVWVGGKDSSLSGDAWRQPPLRHARQSHTHPHTPRPSPPGTCSLVSQCMRLRSLCGPKGLDSP